MRHVHSTTRTSRTLLALCCAAAVCLTAFSAGCEQPSQPESRSDAESATETDVAPGSTDDPVAAEQPEIADTAGEAEDPSAMADAQDEDATEDVENVITRSLPRFHDAWPNDEAFLDWQESFYIHRELARVHEATANFCASELYEDLEGRIPFAAFVGQVFAQNDAAVDRCWDELMLEGREDELITLAYGAWLANTPHSRQIYFRARQTWIGDVYDRLFHSLHQAKVTDTLERPLSDPRVVRMLWNEFFATGDEERLRKVVVVAYMHNAPEGTWQRLAGQASLPILERVLPHDPLVRRVAEEEAAQNPSVAVRTHLTMLLEEVGPLRDRPETSPAS